MSEPVIIMITSMMPNLNGKQLAMIAAGLWEAQRDVEPSVRE